MTNPSPVGYYFDVSANPEGLKKLSLFHVLIIATLAIGLYLNTLKNDFVYDDVYTTIVNNTLIKSFDNLPLLFDKTAYFSRSGEMSYRPVVTFTYFIDYALFGLKPWGYHLTNVLLHAVNGTLLYFFLNLLLTPGTVPILRRSEAMSVNRDCPLSHSSRFTSPAFLISILFVSHPVLTETVNCISYREDLLVFLFYVTTLSLYLILGKPTTDCRPLATALLYLLSCITYLLALLSKEMAVTLPLIIFCYEWLYGKEKRLPSRLFNRYTMGYVVITLFYLYLRFYLFHNPKGQIEVWSLVERFLTLPWLVMGYLKLSFLPVQLSADYGINPVNSPFSPIFILSIIALISIFTIILLYKRRDKRFPPLTKGSEGGFENGFSGQRGILFGILFFLITLIPVYSLVPIANPFAERYLYLPVAGFVMSASLFTHLIIEKLETSPEYLNRYVPIFVLIVLIVFFFSVVKRNTIWKDDYSLWFDTVAKMPNRSRAHNNLGRAYYYQGCLDEAIREYLTAIKLRFNNAEAHNNLGVLYSKQGRYDKAVYELKIAIMLKPGYINAYYNLGNTYSRQGLFDQAIKELLAAIRLKPDEAELHYNLGTAYLKKGSYDAAISEFGIALKLKPDYKEAYQNLKSLMGKNFKDAGNKTAWVR